MSLYLAKIISEARKSVWHRNRNSGLNGFMYDNNYGFCFTSTLFFIDLKPVPKPLIIS